MEHFLTSDILNVILQTGAIGIVVIVLSLIFGHIYLEKSKLETKNRDEFRGVLKESNENTNKVMDLYIEQEKRHKDEKELSKLLKEKHSLKVIGLATDAKKYIGKTFECPNCKEHTKLTDENIDKIITVEEDNMRN